jgi:hypothetical protein
VAYKATPERPPQMQSADACARSIRSHAAEDGNASVPPQRRA